MKFRYHSQLHDAGLMQGYSRLLAGVMKEIKYVECNGFDGVWLGEHHLGPEGLANSPNPILMLANIAGQTDFASYGLACVTAPNWHPIRLAEDIAVLDHLCRGRLHIGFGRGVFPRDTAMFHPNGDCRKAESRTLTGEVIEIAKKAWTEEFFSHSGQNFKFPSPGIPHHPWSPTEEPHVDSHGNITKICVVPKPLQRPHPPIWIMVAAESSARLAAENGYNCIAAGTSFDIIRGWLDLYADIRSRKEGRQFKRGECWSLQRPLFVARTMEQAKQRFETYIRRQRQYQALYRGAKAAEYAKVTLGTASDWDWDLLQRTAMLAGSVDFVGEKIQEAADVGITAINVWSDCGGCPHELTMESFQLFAEEVVPRFVQHAEG